MFSKVIVSSLLLAAFANGLVFRRDDGDNTSTPPAISLPTVTPEPIRLPDPSISSLPPLDPSLTPTPTFSLLASSSLPSVVTTTVYVYLSGCSLTGTPLPTPSPSGSPDNVLTLPHDDPLTLPSGGPSSLNLPQETPLNLHPVRRDGSVVTQLRTLQQQVVNTWVDLGKGNLMLSVVGQLESLIAQAATPGADGPALLKQAQSLVNGS